MTASEKVKAQIRTYLAENVMPALPPEIRAISFEITSWLITIHLYQEDVFPGDGHAELEGRIEGLAEKLQPREGEEWESVWSYHRKSAGRPSNPDEEVVYAI